MNWLIGLAALYGVSVLIVLTSCALAIRQSGQWLLEDTPIQAVLLLLPVINSIIAVGCLCVLWSDFSKNKTIWKKK